MKLLLIILISIVAFSILICLLIFLFQEKFLFYPEKLPQDFSFSFPLDFEERFYQADGVVINALCFKIPNPKGVILYFHGNAGSLRSWGGVCSQFIPLGYDLLIFDYRGYGKSSGKISEKALFSDGLFLYDSLAAEYGENMITVFGRSVGSGIAVYVASNRNPATCILEAPFYSMKDLAQHHFPWVPVFLLRYPFRTDRYIEKVTCPVYLFHGTDDSVIYYGSGVKLAKHLKGPSEFFTIKGGGHNNLAHFADYYHNLMHILTRGKR